MTDPFENFDEQLRSYEMLEEHRELLAREAAEVAREHPDAQLVGVAMDADASEAADLQRLLEQQTGKRITGGFLGIMPRALVLDILRANAPATLDWLEPASEGQSRKLPLVAITRRGYRFGVVDYDVTP